MSMIGVQVQLAHLPNGSKIYRRNSVIHSVCADAVFDSAIQSKYLFHPQTHC